MTDIDVGEMLSNLSSTDETIADLEGEMLRLERKVERVKDALYLGSSGTIAERKARASSSGEIAMLRGLSVLMLELQKGCPPETPHSSVDPSY